MQETSLEEQRRLFIESFKQEQKNRLDEFIKRHQDNMPAIDFSDEEIKIFIPEKLLEFSEIDPAKLEIKTNYSSINHCVFDITYNEENIITCEMSQSKFDQLKSIDIIRFSHNDPFRGKGITKSFYENLENIAKSIGFRVVSGSNHIDNINYFVQKLDRYPEFTLIGQDEEYDEDQGYGIGRDWYPTHKFIFKEDEEKYVKEYYRKNNGWKNSVNWHIWPQYSPHAKNQRMRRLGL